MNVQKVEVDDGQVTVTVSNGEASTVMVYTGYIFTTFNATNGGSVRVSISCSPQKAESSERHYRMTEAEG